MQANDLLVRQTLSGPSPFQRAAQGAVRKQPFSSVNLIANPGRILSLTRASNLLSVEMRAMRNRLFIVVALVALLGLQFADCASAMTQDQQSMQCCGSMPCDPSNQSHDCCKGMVSSQSPSVLPVAHVALHAPVIVVTDVFASPQATPYAAVSRLDFEAPQHSPPELYTLHSSLLI